ncbi:hypothetical protein [Frankia sp. Cas4]|uniref:hypothetical protein n=1 Tax=Frankia sp. Cas4 TaxID=3073927 RepID=UPI002AD2B91D|nr:hypothetical protein [Frankia sp. Cas4]
MREATNLGWADTPFGAARRPFAERMSLLAAFAVPCDEGASTAAATAVYLRLPRRPMTVTDTTLRFGFHSVAVDDPSEIPVVVALVDGLLVQARRRAAILAGHRLADELASIAAAAGGRPLRGITAVAACWRADDPERGVARLLDTAHGPHPASLPAVGAGHQLTGLSPDPDPSSDLAPAGSTASSAAPPILRQIVVRALAIVLITAWNVGHYQWGDLHLDAVIEAAAWDQFADLPATPVR